ncbi:putative nucleotide-binding alpha-beta plait domain superfamily, RNA-binding domain superfamily [Helianthus annuus]|nr:putative nucleotide-binding alpha-beta plait domain superfamily, RNA-binding domain superfamily [Helianthus annuus]KAJ0745824.1 putative nucleotide-binding alpha-beta plait domain superfamily, RNA-binding domain superfamily [Helianthus annuus]
MQPATTPLMDPQYQQQQWMMMNQQPPVQQMYNYSQQPPPAATIPQHYTSPLSASIGGATPQPATADEIRTLWIGDLQYWMDEQYLLSCFAQTGELQFICSIEVGVIAGTRMVFFLYHVMSTDLNCRHDMKDVDFILCS